MIRKQWIVVFIGIMLTAIPSNIFGASQDSTSTLAELVDIKRINSRIQLGHGFRRTPNSSGCYMRKAVAQKLDCVQQELEQMGYSLKIESAYRPLSVQKQLWKAFPDSRYVANPTHGSRHNRGAAVDVRLVRISDGQDLEMPSRMADFTDRAHRDYERMTTEESKKNCKLLELIMEKHGFKGLRTEWWHFDCLDWANYPVLDVSFHELEKAHTDVLPMSTGSPVKMSPKAKRSTKNKTVKHTYKMRSKTKIIKTRRRVTPREATPNKAVPSKATSKITLTH